LKNAALASASVMVGCGEWSERGKEIQKGEASTGE